MIKPIGNKVLLRLEKQKPDSLIIFTDETDDKKSTWRFFVEAIGDEVPCIYKTADELSKNKDKEYPLKLNDELILFNHAHLQGWPECEKWEGKNLRLISIQDIWGVIKK